MPLPRARETLALTCARGERSVRGQVTIKALARPKPDLDKLVQVLKALAAEEMKRQQDEDKAA